MFSILLSLFILPLLASISVHNTGTTSMSMSRIKIKRRGLRLRGEA
jgi:hypothetical protein